MPKSSKSESKKKANLKHRTSTRATKAKGRAASKPSSKLLKVPKKSVDRKNDALARFVRSTGITEKQIEQTPHISDILKSSMGSVTAAIDMLRFSNETCAIELLTTYDSLPSGDRDRLPIEAICVKAKVSPAAVLGAALMACRTVRGQQSALIAMNRHPEVLQKTIEVALTPGGDRDRKMIHEATGFLPTPKGGSINVNLLNGIPQSGAQAQNKPKEVEDPDDFNDVFPSITGNLNHWSEDRHKLLLAEGENV